MATLPDDLAKKLPGLALNDAAYLVLDYVRRQRWQAHPSAGDGMELLASAFPGVTRSKIETAYNAAAKLEGDHLKYFVPGPAGDYGQDLRLAADQARAANPGFSEDTYFLAYASLATTMR